MTADIVRPSEFKPTIGSTDYNNPHNLASTGQVVLEGDTCNLRVKAYGFNPEHVTDVGMELHRRDERLVTTQIGQVRAVIRVSRKAWVNSAAVGAISSEIVETLVNQAKYHYARSEHNWPYEGL